jgi:hypothetical protein
MQTFDVLTADNKVIRWTGEDGEDACRRVADAKRVTVVAWRHPKVELVIGTPNIDG